MTWRGGSRHSTLTGRAASCTASHARCVLPHAQGVYCLTRKVRQAGRSPSRQAAVATPPQASSSTGASGSGGRGLVVRPACRPCARLAALQQPAARSLVSSCGRAPHHPCLCLTQTQGSVCVRAHAAGRRQRQPPLLPPSPTLHLSGAGHRDGGSRAGGAGAGGAGIPRRHGAGRPPAGAPDVDGG